MAEPGQAGNTRTAGGSGRGVLLDFGSVRVQVPSDAQLQLDAVESKLVRVDTSAGRIDLCVLAAPRSSSLWSRMSRDVAASQAGKGARVHTESGEWGDEVLSARDGQLSRYVAMDGPGWMLFGLALGPEETTVELAETLRLMMRSALVRRGNEPMPEKTALPITVPPGLAQSGPSGADASSVPETDHAEAAQPESEGARARQAGPVFQLGPTGSRQARGMDRARPNSGHGPATRPGSVARHGSATRHGSTAPTGPAGRSGSGAAARAGAMARSGAAGAGPGRDNRAPASAPVPEQRRGRWARAGQVSLVLGVVACLAAMLGWMFSGNSSAELHYTPAVAMPPRAEGPTPGNDLALGNLSDTTPGSGAEGQPSQSAPDLGPDAGQVTAPNTTAPNTTAPNTTAPNTTAPNLTAPNSSSPSEVAPKQVAPKHPTQKPANQAPARAAHGPARSGRSMTSVPTISGGSVPQHRATVQAPTTRSGDDAKTHSGDESTSRDDDESSSSDDRHSDHSDHSDRHDHRRDRDDVTPLGGLGRTLGGLGLPVGG